MHYHGRRGQTLRLFSSSKPFCVAKSTPLLWSLTTISSLGHLATSSAKLSSMSKLLSKPSLFFVPLVLLSYTQGTQALSVYTSRAIEGNAPYLTFDGGRTKLTSTDSLLFIELPDGTRYTKSTNPSTSTNPIRLPNTGASFNDINMIVPTQQSSITMNDLVTQGNWGDDDGDGQATATGSISVTFTDKNGNTVSRSDALDVCKSPYKVTLTSSSGTLTTQYGVPRSSSFSGDSVDYYINPYDYAGICSVRPNLVFGSQSIAGDNASKYAGPANIWSIDKGFLIQSTNSSSYDQNFPTTGADGLYFDLDVVGVDATQLTWPSVTHSGITATVTVVTANNYWIPTADVGKQVARVKLNGPRADRTQISSSNPSPLFVPSLPQTFELVGSDSSGNAVVKYGFKLAQWFVNRGDKDVNASDQAAWCSSLGYRLSQVSDLTNANCGVNNTDFPCINGINGATPSSIGNHYQRRIGGGLFSEWGYVYNYENTGFVNFYYGYWTSDNISGDRFCVHSDIGVVRRRPPNFALYAVCTTP